MKKQHSVSPNQIPHPFHHHVKTTQKLRPKIFPFQISRLCCCRFWFRSNRHLGIYSIQKYFGKSASGNVWQIGMSSHRAGSIFGHRSERTGCYDRSNRKAETRLHSEQRQRGSVDHFVTAGSAQIQYANVSHGWRGCWLRESNVCLPGNWLRESRCRSDRWEN